MSKKNHKKQRIISYNNITNQHDSSSPSYEKYFYIILVITILLVFSQVITFDFIGFDDDRFIVRNIYVLKGLVPESIIWAFTNTQGYHLYMPVAWLAHMASVSLFSTNPAGHHAINLILHIACTLMFYFFLRKTTKQIWPSFMAALLFAIHPLRSESVAFISERNGLIGNFFFFTSLVAYIYYVKYKISKWYFIVLASYILGLLSKPLIITLPVILLILDWWPLQRVNENTKTFLKTYKILIKEKIPFFIVAAVFSLVTIMVDKAIYTVSDPLHLRLATAVVSYVRYVGKLFWPENLTIYYPHSQFLYTPLFFALSFSLLLSITVFAFKVRKNLPFLLAGWLWFLVNLIPVIGILPQSSRNIIADRYTYTSHIALLFAIVWSVDYFSKKNYVFKYIAIFTGILLSIIMTYQSVIQTRYWKNSITLFEHALQITKNNDVAHSSLCVSYYRTGDFKTALGHCNKAIQIMPDNPLYLVNKNKLVSYMNNYDLNTLIELHKKDPDNADIEYKLAILLARKGKIQEAEKHFRNAIDLKPDFSQVYADYAVTLIQQEKYDEAIENLEKSISIDPDNTHALYHLSVAYLNTGRKEEAITQLNEVLRINPNFQPAILLLRKINIIRG